LKVYIKYSIIINHYLKIFTWNLVCPSLKTVQRKVLSLTILTAGDIFFKNAWVKKSRLMLLDKSLKDMFSKSLVVMIVTVLLWNKVYSLMVVLDSYLNLVLQDIVLKELDKERENLFVVALLVLILKCFLALLLRKEKRKFPD
jgi:hypothetical protein